MLDPKALDYQDIIKYLNPQVVRCTNGVQYYDYDYGLLLEYLESIGGDDVHNSIENEVENILTELGYIAYYPK